MVKDPSLVKPSSFPSNSRHSNSTTTPLAVYQYITDSDELSSNGSPDSEYLPSRFSESSRFTESSTHPSFVIPIVTKTHYTSVRELCRIIQDAIDCSPPMGISVDQVFERVYSTQAVRMTASIESDFIGFVNRHITTADIYADLKDGVLQKFEGY